MLGEPRLYLRLKAYAHTLYILIQCADIFYVNGSTLSNMKNSITKFNYLIFLKITRSHCSMSEDSPGE